MHVHSGPLPVDAIVRFLRIGIDHGEAGLVLTTPSHAERLRQALGPADARCTFLDADAELARCTTGPMVDPGRFHDVVAGRLRVAREGGNGGVRVWSELASLLCARGEHAAALEVEHLWGLLLRGQRAAVLCTFPSRAFTGWGEEVLDAVSREHGRRDVSAPRGRRAPRRATKRPSARRR